MSGAANQRAWRSILFVPAHVQKYWAKAAASEADAVQLDLEDSVPEGLKQAAREALPQAVPLLRQQGKAVLVRINRALPLAVADLQAAVACGADAISLTKVEGAEHVQLLEEVVAEAEQIAGRAATTRLIAICESPRAFLRLSAIAQSSPRITGLMLGSEDFSLACDAQPDDEVLLMPKQQVVIAARAAGVVPYGYIGTISGLDDMEAYRQMVRRSRRFGFQGGTCVHPKQVSILNEEFGVSPAQRAYALEVVQAYEAAVQDGRGACLVQGAMVDLPMYQRAQRSLALGGTPGRDA